MKFARKVYRQAECYGRMFDARVYLEHRQGGWPAEAAMWHARRAYTGRETPWRKALWARA